MIILLAAMLAAALMSFSGAVVFLSRDEEGDDEERLADTRVGKILGLRIGLSLLLFITFVAVTLFNTNSIVLSAG